MKTTQAISQLRATGRRMTVQRRAVLNALAQLGCAQDVMDIYLRARRTYPRLGLVTVYRTLDALIEQRLVSALHFGDGRTRYELIDEAHHHHHLVCLACGLVEPYEECLVQALEGTRLRRGFRVTSHHLDLFGYCRRCGRKRTHLRRPS